MKTLLILLFLIGSINVAYTQTQKINAEVTWGGTRCNGAHGLCYVNISETKNATNAQLYLNEKGNMEMEIFQNKLTGNELVMVLGETFKTNKSWYKFYLEDTYVLPEELKVQLKLPQHLGELPKGNYPAEVKNGVIVVVFDIR